MDTQPIANLDPHYTNSHYREPRTVWIAKGYKANGRNGTVNQSGVGYDYSDRIWQWNWEKARSLTETIDASLDRRSPAFIQEFLRGFFDDQTIELVHVMAGFNPSNGYSYRVYGYKRGQS